MAQGHDNPNLTAVGQRQTFLAGQVLEELKAKGVVPSTAKVRASESLEEMLDRFDINPHRFESGRRDPSVDSLVHEIVHGLKANMETYSGPREPVPAVTADGKQADIASIMIASQQSNDVMNSGYRMLTQTEYIDMVQTWYDVPFNLQQASQTNLPKGAVARFVMPVTVADILSHKNEVYPKPVWDSNVQSLKQMAQSKRLLGRNDHPGNPGEVLSDASLVFDDVYWAPMRRHDQGWELCASGFILDTTAGRDLHSMLQFGVPIDVSSRGMGKTAPGQWKGVPASVVQDFICKGFDAVLGGASPGASFTAATLQQSNELEQSKETKPVSKVEASLRRKPLLRVRFGVE